MKPFFLERAVVVSSVVLSSSSAFQLRQSFHRRHDNLASPSISGRILEAKKKVVEDGDGVDLSSKPSSMDPAKRAALDGVLNQIERSYGRGSIVKLGDAGNMVVESISTGALTLDAALGGGFPKGRVIEIYGPESSGKTTLALHAIAECQKAGGIAAFVDAEHALDPVYAAGLGVGVDDLLVSQPDSGEMALDIVDQLVRSSAVDVIVVDSVAALVPRAELEGDMSDSQIGLQARLMSKAMRKITGSLSLSQCTVIFLNQLRSKVGVIYGSPEVTSGGNALKFYASVRLDTRRKEILPDNKGIRVKVKVVKNKVAAPFKAVMLDIIFGTGIDSWGCTLDAALDLGIVERRGSWYAYQGNQLAQGRHNVVEYLKTNDLGESIKEDVRQALANYGQPVDLDDDGDVDMPDADIDLEISNSSEELITGFE
ncbi:recombinase A [Nitzschia inconspicua]|uniref:Recombinase A n=1 Tax=Nitzschia inconspicua TaxID=303405 RepID=A0A9K3KEL7_9STRA|nr:recombinase A [Nitzschia inconspicua]